MRCGSLKCACLWGWIWHVTESFEVSGGYQGSGFYFQKNHVLCFLTPKKALGTNCSCGPRHLGIIYGEASMEHSFTKKLHLESVMPIDVSKLNLCFSNTFFTLLSHRRDLRTVF